MQLDFVTTFGFVQGFPSFPEAVLARALTANGHNVRALTYYAKSSSMINAHHAVIDGTAVHRIRRKGLITPGVLGWIARDAPDVAHVHHHSNRMSFLAVPAYHARRVPVVFSPYGILHDPVLVADTDRPLQSPLKFSKISPSLRASAHANGARRGVFIWALHRALFVADLIHAMSEHERRVLIELGLPEDRVRFVPIGIDATLLTAPEPVARTVDPTVLFIGQTKYRKGWDVLVRAIPAVRAKLPTVRFIFVGHTGRDQDEFSRLVAELDVGDVVEARGRVTEVEKVCLLRSSWVLTLPARYEGFGLPLVEAMMVGTPVVTTDVPACNELVRHGATGLVVPPDDPSALADALIQMLDESALRERLGASGQAEALQRYEAQVVARAFEQLYAEAIERRR